jgi:hypothetical protein
MFVLNGRPLSLDRPFEANGTLYPANWLRLASPAERAAIGITEEPDAPTYDQRFYWGYTASGTLIPKDHGQLVTQWTDQTRQTANSLLTPTDWMVVREADNGAAVPSGIRSWRQDIRYACEGKVTTLTLTQDTPGLADYVTYVTPSGGASTDYNYWPQYVDPASAVATSADEVTPVAPEITPSGDTSSGDTISFSSTSTQAGF